jgi:hypothetical protein
MERDKILRALQAWCGNEKREFSVDDLLFALTRDRELEEQLRRLVRNERTEYERAMRSNDQRSTPRPLTLVQPRSYRTEFPDFVMDLEIPVGWEDTSWHNDTCPSFDAGQNRTVWVNYPKEGDREMPDGKRFAIQMRDDEGAYMDQYLLETDDWEELLRMIREV